jgi:pilus assembly protein CpaF
MVFHVQTAPSSLPDYVAVKERVQQQLITTVSPGSDLMTPGKARQVIEPMFNEALAAENLILNRNERAHLFQMILAEILGFGPIQPLLEDETLSEVMVNGAKQVYVERGGKLLLTDVVFEDDDHVLRIIERIVSPLGRRIDESSPMVNARLPDGSRVNAIIAPLSLVGPVLTIRKFSKIPFTVEDLIGFGTFTRESVQFIEAAVKARLNIVVSGGTGSGKTTLLNIVSRFIPHDERIVTIEDAAELQLQQDHVVRLETRPPNIEGKGQVTIRDLVVNALRMRPDRIVVGECRSGEALDMLQAMNTGHDGSITTVHSNSPRDTLARMETMVLMAGMDLPLRAIRQQIASALDLIIHIERLRDGSRRVVKISEVIGMEGETILMQDIFVFAEEDTEGDKIKGRLQATGLRPRVMEKIEAAHIPLPLDIFYVYAPRGR